MKIFQTIIGLCLVLSCLTNAETLVSTQDEFFSATKNLSPGDTVVLADGVWRDFEIVLEGDGTAHQPITLTAQTKGNVVISGRSNLRIAGNHLVVKGLIFKDGYTPTNTVISFRRSKQKLANHSRITEVVVDHFNNPERHETDFWVMVYGKHNRFDHNYLVGKSNKGVTMAVRLDSPESQENHHRIDHNYFGHRPVLGSNGGETLRIGTSAYSMSNSFTVVEANYFNHCNGEVEIVSSKSGGNTFTGNVFLESQGTLTLRHGNENTVENNVFFGNHVEHTGGIRVINKRQLVRNNYLYGLTGHRFGGALVIMNGVPNSPINRYHQVEDSIVENNSIIESSHIELAAGSDAERSAPPITTSFQRNLIYNSDGKDIIAVHDDIQGIDFAGNVTNVSTNPKVGPGISQEDLELQSADNGLHYPTDDRFAHMGVSRSLRVLTKDETGPNWYPKKPIGGDFDTGTTIEISPSEDSLSEAVNGANSGDIIILADGEYGVPRTLVINHPLTLRAKAKLAARVSFERASLFELRDGGSLKLDGLLISGSAAPDMAGNSLIRTSRQSMLSNYSLVITNSTIKNLDTNHSFNVLSLSKHTFAGSVAISYSVFEDISGDVLQMNQEIDDLGIYNVEYVTITDSSFKNIGGAVANIYRGGTDESTFGPHFLMTRTTLENIGLGSRNKTRASLWLYGVQIASIEENSLIDSSPIRVTHTVGDPITSISKNRYIATPEPVIDVFERNK